MSSNATIFIDSRERANADILGNRTQWTEYTLAQLDPYTCFGNSWEQPNVAASGEGLFDDNFTFDGVAIAIYGFVERSKLEISGNISFSTTIDSDPTSTQQRNFFAPADPPTAFRPWYISQNLPSGQHSVFVGGFPSEGVYIDYFTVDAGPSTTVSNQSLVIDENDPLIRYFGQWQVFSDIYLTVSNPLTYSATYGGGTHISNTTGDAVQIPFTGSSVSVYGLLRWNITGSISLRFSLDDQPSEEKTFPPPGASKPKNETLVETHYLFYNSSALSAGDHVLQINVTDVEGEFAFDLDMILYNASFNSPRHKPTVTIPPLRIQSPDPLTMEKKHKLSKGIIAGGVVAALLILSVIIVYLLYKKRQKKSDGTTVNPFYIRPRRRAGAAPAATTLASRFPFPTTILSWNPIGGGILSHYRGKVQEGNQGQAQMDVSAMAERNRITGRIQELQGVLAELERENQLLQEQQIDPPPYRETIGNRAREELQRELEMLMRETDVSQEWRADPPSYESMTQGVGVSRAQIPINFV